MNDLYNEMLQHQEWLNMLGADDSTEEKGTNEDDREGRGREHGRHHGHCCGRKRGFGGIPPGCGPPPFMQFFMGGGGPCGPQHGPPHGPPHGHGPPGPPPPFGPPPHGPPHGGRFPPFGPPHGGRGPHGGGRGPHGGGRGHGGLHGPRGALPRVDVFEEKSQYVLLADVPGFTKKDAEILVADEKLTLKGKLPGAGAGAGEDDHPLLCERRPLHSFDRTFQLPHDVDAAKITAKLEHGVLRIVLPRKEGSEPKPVPIGGGGASGDEDFVDVDDEERGAA